MVGLVAVVDHAVELYFRTGITDLSYTVLSICSLAPHVVPASVRMIALHAFPSVRRECVFHVSLLSNVTPRSSSSSFRVCVPILMELSFYFGDRVNSVMEDLSLLTVTHQSSVHDVSCSMTC